MAVAFRVPTMYFVTGELPEPSALNAGQLWVIPAGLTGEEPYPAELAICLQNADGSYDWQDIASGNAWNPE